MSIQPIIKRNISDEIASRLQNLIQDGYFKLGEKLPAERDLCDQFKVSRTSIREALKVLLSKGLVEKRSDGTYICESLKEVFLEPINLLLSAKKISIAEIFEARRILEIQNAGLAAVNATEEDLRAIQECLDGMEIANARDGKLKNMVNFHQAVANASHNQVLADLYRVIYGILERLRFEDRTPTEVDLSIHGHIEIFEQIKKHNKEAARASMKHHLAEVANLYK